MSNLEFVFFHRSIYDIPKRCKRQLSRKFLARGTI